MRELGRVFRTYCHNRQTTWINYVKDMEDCCNNLPHSSNGYAPIEVVTGKPPEHALTNIIKRYLPKLLPDVPNLKDIHDKVHYQLQFEERKRLAAQKKQTQRYEIGEYVLLKSYLLSNALEKINQKLCLLYEVPYEIIAKPYINVHTLLHPETRTVKWTYNVANLKRYHKIEPQKN